ncbi:MAG TPA: enoyl-CoA hydratase/isomerase family protein [Alphaproteobacteria bacterium]|nr:enoyl-CoA hydratase/isomerase family protein [Alphaproteobacteria bacterium]
MPDIYSHYSRLKISRPGPGILRVELNRPEKLNATDEAMHLELVNIWRVIDEDPETSVSILTGAGRAFSAGGDFELLRDNIEDPTKRAAHWKQARDLVYNIVNSSKPIVSAIRGAAVGAGLTAALLADISIASKTARIIDGHTRLGVAAGDHAAIVWPLLCGMAKAKYHLLLCEPVSGEEAERIGLVSLSVEDEELDAAALRIATRLVEGAPSAIRWTKYALNNWLRMAGPTFDTSLALEFLGFAGTEVKEGLASHLEKRAPRFDRSSPV